jgi:membrane fusion protein (multidrug efflux system)
VDGSQTPPLKFDQVGYQTQFEPPKTKRAADNQRRRNRLLTMLAAVVLVSGVGYGTYWYAVGRHYESTNDAYLGADSVTIAPNV